MSQALPLVQWNPADSPRIESEVFVARHRLHELACFGDEQLAALLDRYPRQHLGVNTMGDDPLRRSDWREGTAGDYSGAELLKIVAQGKLWLNLRKVTRHDVELAAVVQTMYDELEAAVPGYQARNRSANLLISSPPCQVYYHCDLPINVLWHIRGQKRVWVYPRRAPFLETELLEDILVGAHSEEIPYRLEMDTMAQAYDLSPGQVVFWPQHSPHRVQNWCGLNVSLSTEHMSRTSIRRNNVHIANRTFRKAWPWGFRDDAIAGPAAAAKEAAIRVLRRIPGLGPNDRKGYKYPVSFAVDAAAPDGIRLLGDTAPAAAAELEPLAM